LQSLGFLNNEIRNKKNVGSFHNKNEVPIKEVGDVKNIG
jgi:hypothetical protein